MKNTLKKVIVISKTRVFIKGGRLKQALFVGLFRSESLISYDSIEIGSVLSLWKVMKAT